MIAVVLFLLFALGGAGIYYFQPVTWQSNMASSNIKSIAVMPFKQIGNGSGGEKFGLGMADAIITRLSNLQRIVVRPSSVVFSYTDRGAVEVITAGRQLGVDAVLEGIVQYEGERVRVSVQLIRVSDGKPLWAESFNEKVSDIFGVQDSISARVATALSINLTQQQEQLLA
jgi:TolB-like protein